MLRRLDQKTGPRYRIRYNTRLGFDRRWVKSVGEKCCRRVPTGLVAAAVCSGGGAEAALEEMLDALRIGAYQLWIQKHAADTK